MLPLVDVAYTAAGEKSLSDPIATNNPAELTVMSLMRAETAAPFMRAGVVHVLPSVDVAYKGALELSDPTATNNPAALTVTPTIIA